MFGTATITLGIGPHSSLVLSCGVIVVFSCCRRWHNNLNEPLDTFPFWVAAEQKGGRG